MVRYNTMLDKYTALIGLGVVGAPLADLLEKKYKNDFALLSSENFLPTLKNLYINGREFQPKIFSNPIELDRKIGILFICVKNYHLESTCQFLKTIIDDDTIIVPLQNGVYSFDYLSKQFPNNCILEGFIQGPNTKITPNGFIYQRSGTFHIGTSNKKFIESGKIVYEIMRSANVECYYDDNIKVKVWKKLMLNVAANAITALTEIDYCMFKNSLDTQNLCRKVMKEFIKVAKTQGVEILETDIEDTINYFLSFKVPKRTSMLDDVLNKRCTENEYIAGYISRLAQKYDISVPNIDMLHTLMKIKEEVYLNKLL